ncbi:MAG: hypothetical protein BZY88_20580 [SAR202 cluster bacterium Io17-Chloro-G9]|nr:MAG: hypothetical protein BZY88_20580 [SAR202 cluster bacterium Io17-Chloro-G9]
MENPASTLWMVSVDSRGNQGNGPSGEPSISGDGRFIAFSSQASNLVGQDTNGSRDIFVHDREMGITRRVSLSSGGAQGNGSSGQPAISADGHFVAFFSIATNLAPGDTNGTGDVFLHELATGLTRRVSVASGGAQGNGFSDGPSISGDGRYVAFESSASNLVAGDNNNNTDVFVHDSLDGSTIGAWANPPQLENLPGGAAAISANGLVVAFAVHLPDWASEGALGRSQVLVHDIAAGATELAGGEPENIFAEGAAGVLSLSADGSWVVFRSNDANLAPEDTNGADDVFAIGREPYAIHRVSVDSQGNQGNGASGQPSVGGDGRFVAFWSEASNLTPGDSNGIGDVFVHDRQTGETRRISAGPNGTQGGKLSGSPSLSSDARFLAFESEASNLAPGDANGQQDVFVAENPLHR